MNLIVGASGYIGGRLLKQFDEKEKSVGTYFRNQKEGLVYLDLENPDLSRLGINPEEVKYGFVCSATSRIDECKKDEKRAYRINVIGIKKLLQQFSHYGIMPIFFSSDFVFDGKRGNYKEEDERNPCTVYGRHKKDIEDFLINGNNKFLIIRLAKIFGTEKDDGTLLTSWLNQLKRGEEIFCAEDQIFCPTHIDDLVKALRISLEWNLTGVYNLASPESFSRFGLARMLKSQLEIKTGDVKPCLIKDFHFLDSRSLNTSMNCQKFLNNTGYVFHSMESYIEEMRKLI